MSIEKIKEAAEGRILEILENVAGIPSEILEHHRREHPCPKCGGDTRCRLINQETGAIFCNQCFNKGCGDFIATVQHFREVSLPEALKLIANYLEIKTADGGRQMADKIVTKIREWIYQTADGKPYYKVVRKDYADGTKECFQYRYVESPEGGGKYISGLTDELKKTGGVPLRLPELNRRQDETVFIVEGEGKSDAVFEFGLLATSASSGASAKLDWSSYIQNRHVVILPDNDKPGYRYALATADALRKAGCTIKVVFLPGLGESEDVADWIERGGTRDELLQIVDDTPVWSGDNFLLERYPESAGNTDNTEPSQKIGPVIMSFDEIEEGDVSWLLQDVFPMGAVSVLVGKPGLGKSFLTCWLAANVSSDGTVCFRSEPIPGGSVIICNAEDDAGKIIKKRLRKNGANLSRVKTIQHVLTESRNSRGKTVIISEPITLEMIDAFRKAFEVTPDCRLLIIDPVSAFWGEINDHNNAQVRAAMAQLKVLAEEFNVAIVLVTHLNKTPSTDASVRITGSGGLPAAGRANWLLSLDESGLRTVSLIKTNVSVNKAGFTFRITDGQVSIVDSEVDISADEVLQEEAEARAAHRKGRKPEQIEAAKRWLQNFLADGQKLAGSENNPVHGSVRHESERANHAWATMRRAATELNVNFLKKGRHSFWELPANQIYTCSESSPIYPPNCEQVSGPANSSTSNDTCSLAQNTDEYKDCEQVSENAPESGQIDTCSELPPIHPLNCEQVSGPVNSSISGNTCSLAQNAEGYGDCEQVNESDAPKPSHPVAPKTDHAELPVVTGMVRNSLDKDEELEPEERPIETEGVPFGLDPPEEKPFDFTDTDTASESSSPKSWKMNPEPGNVVAKLSGAELAATIRAKLASGRKPNTVNYVSDVLPHFDGNRTKADIFLMNHDFIVETIDGEQRVANWGVMRKISSGEFIADLQTKMNLSK